MKILSAITLFLIIIACDDDSSDKAKYHQISSILFTDRNGRIYSDIEVEETFTSYTDGNKTLKLINFPNPADKESIVELLTTQNTGVKIWLEPAIFIGPDSVLTQSNIDGFPADTFDITPKYLAGEEILVAELDISQGVSNFNLDYSSIKPGFFKLFAEFGDTTLYDNIWIARFK